LAEKRFSEIRIFEQRAKVGGLWNYSPASDNAPDRDRIPQTNPRADLEQPTWGIEREDGVEDYKENEFPIYMSPVYDNLESNIPRELMGFSDLDWPKNCQLFPRHETVLEYLEHYARDVMDHIDFQTQVLDVKPKKDGKWRVTTQQHSSKQLSTAPNESIFDAVLIASGHFSVLFVPQVTGIEAWDRTYPGSILHSKFYRKPDSYVDKRVIVVGNSASGIDIASQIATKCKPPLIQSRKSESFLQPDQSPTRVEKPEIVEYIPEGRKVRFADGSIEPDVDAILYCTGYFYSFPFLESLDPPVISSGEYVENLYQHIFYRPQPTLSFVALNQKIIPFPVAEAQSAVVARVWSGRLKLPSYNEMEGWERSTLQETGGGRNFHVLKFPKDADYINMLHDWAISVDQSAGKHHELHKRRLSSSTADHTHGQMGSGRTHGKQPPYWGEKEYWTRERFPSIKKVREIPCSLFYIARHCQR
jgi:cation diffusion facilitator CzcD-associated flavoprotein CzcO